MIFCVGRLNARDDAALLMGSIL